MVTTFLISSVTQAALLLSKARLIFSSGETVTGSIFVLTFSSFLIALLSARIPRLLWYDFATLIAVFIVALIAFRSKSHYWMNNQSHHQ
jgi:hypothetical protein